MLISAKKKKRVLKQLVENLRQCQNIILNFDMLPWAFVTYELLGKKNQDHMKAEKKIFTKPIARHFFINLTSWR